MKINRCSINGVERWKEYARILIPSLRRTLLPSLNASWRKDASSPRVLLSSPVVPPRTPRPSGYSVLACFFHPVSLSSSLCPSVSLFSLPAPTRPFWRSGYRCYARRAPRRSTNGPTKSYEDSRGCTIVCTSGCATVLRYSGWCPAVLRIDYTVRSFPLAHRGWNTQNIIVTYRSTFAFFFPSPFSITRERESVLFLSEPTKFKFASRFLSRSRGSTLAVQSFPYPAIFPSKQSPPFSVLYHLNPDRV